MKNYLILKSQHFVIPLMITATFMSGCAPLLLGGAAVGGAFVALDRRTAGTQVDDKALQVQLTNQIHDALNQTAHVEVTVYNRVVLLTGEVIHEADRQKAETLAQRGNVSRVINDLSVQPPTSATIRANDALVSTKVRATLVNDPLVFSNAIKTNTTRSTVYLLGQVTQQEADRAIELIRAVPGVQKVVSYFDIMTAEEIARLNPRVAPPQAAASGVVGQ